MVKFSFPDEKSHNQVPDRVALVLNKPCFSCSCSTLAALSGCLVDRITFLHLFHSSLLFLCVLLRVNHAFFSQDAVGNRLLTMADFDPSIASKVQERSGLPFSLAPGAILVK